MNVPIELSSKMVLIDIEVVNAQLDYNLLLGRSYMYVMQAMASTIFQLLMFPHDGKIVTVNELTYYDPKGMAMSEHILLTISSTIDSVSIPSLCVVGPGLFSNTPMMDTFLSLPTSPTSTEVLDLCTITSSTIPNTL